MTILRYKGKIDFDNWETSVNIDDKSFLWSDICGTCMRKYGLTNESFEIDYDASGGVCGCLGCLNSPDNYFGSISYIDFNMEEIEFLEV